MSSGTTSHTSNPMFSNLEFVRSQLRHIRVFFVSAGHDIRVTRSEEHDGRIWMPFIPVSAREAFQRGGYFSVEVIPDAVAVVSLNTLYFFNLNKGAVYHSASIQCLLHYVHSCTQSAVGGCVRSDAQDPGNMELDWLEDQLKMFRDRSLQVSLCRLERANMRPIIIYRFGYRDTLLHFHETISLNVSVRPLGNPCASVKELH